MYQSLSFEQVKPFIRYAHIIQVNESSYFNAQQAYDCRLFYTVSGTGNIKINNTNYPMERGCLLYWQPEIVYHISTENCNNLIYLGFNFDFTQKHKQLSTPIPPVSPENYKRNLILEQIRFTNIETFNVPVYLREMQHLEESLLNILNEYDNKKLFYSERLSGEFLSILSLIARTSLIQSLNLKSPSSRIDEIIHYIQLHYPDEITNKKLGEIFHYHPNYINKLMVTHTGLSLHQYLLDFRIDKAINLVQTTDLPITDIAKIVGFQDYNHFLKYFKQKTGRTTSEYRM